MKKERINVVERLEQLLHFVPLFLIQFCTEGTVPLKEFLQGTYVILTIFFFTYSNLPGQDDNKTTEKETFPLEK
jgi:hypothetical protein